MKITNYLSRLYQKGIPALKLLRDHPWVSSFIALAAIKIVLLVLGRDQLAQEHFRISSEAPRLWRQLLISGLLGVSILVPTWRQSKVQIRTRGKSALFLFAIVLAVLLPTVLDKNHIYTAWSGALPIWDIRHYLVMDAFFQTPYFVLHALAIAVGWVVGGRRGDDRIFLSVYALSLSVLCASLLARDGQAISLNDIWLLLVLLTLGLAQNFF